MNCWKIALVIIAVIDAIICYACLAVAAKAEGRLREEERKCKTSEANGELAVSVWDGDNRQYSGLLTEED